MSAKIQDLQAELTALQRQIDAIDLPNIQVQIDSAKADLALSKPESYMHLDTAHSELLQAVSRAENLLAAEKNKLRDLTRRVQPLRAMLHAPTKLQAAREDLATLQSRAAEAATVVATAQATKTALAGLLADAQASYAGHLEDAAKGVLLAAKQGKAIAPTPTDRGQVDALESALQMAQTELETAQARHAESLSDLQAAQRQLTQATADAAGLRFELQARDFADAVCAFEFAGGIFDAADLSERCLIAQQNAAGLLESMAEENATG